MKCEIRMQDLDLKEALRQYVAHHLRLALGRFEGRMRRVSCQIRDVNGPRGGTDKMCQIRIRVEGGQEVLVRDHDSDLYAAIHRAIHRAGRALLRQADRRASSLIRESVREPADSRRGVTALVGEHTKAVDLIAGEGMP